MLRSRHRDLIRKVSPDWLCRTGKLAREAGSPPRAGSEIQAGEDTTRSGAVALSVERMSGAVALSVEGSNK